jgi:hypothetical protein
VGQARAGVRLGLEADIARARLEEAAIRVQSAVSIGAFLARRSRARVRVALMYVPFPELDHAHEALDPTV